MKHHTLAGQIKTIRENTRALRTYIRWKKCGTKAKYFKKSELEDKIFHLGVIIQTTDEVKISRSAIAQRRIFVGILGREYQERPREAIIGRLTKYVQESKNKFEELKKERKLNERGATTDTGNKRSNKTTHHERERNQPSEQSKVQKTTSRNRHQRK